MVKKIVVKVTCVHCHKNSPKNSIADHTVSVHKINTFACGECGNFLGSVNNLAIHKSSKHPPKKPIQKVKKQQQNN